MRRIAVRTLSQGRHTYTLRVVELDDTEAGTPPQQLEGARVVRHYPLTAELPHTEWLPVAVRVGEDGRLTILRN